MPASLRQSRASVTREEGVQPHISGHSAGETFHHWPTSDSQTITPTPIQTTYNVRVAADNAGTGVQILEGVLDRPGAITHSVCDSLRAVHTGNLQHLEGGARHDNYN